MFVQPPALSQTDTDEYAKYMPLLFIFATLSPFTAHQYDFVHSYRACARGRTKWPRAIHRVRLLFGRRLNHAVKRLHDGDTNA